MCEMLLDPNTTNLDVRVSQDGDLHCNMLVLMGQCIAHLVGTEDRDKCTFSLKHVTDDVIRRVSDGFLKMGVQIQITDSGKTFVDPPNILRSHLDKSTSVIPDTSKKVRFVFVSETHSCSAQYTQNLNSL